MAQKKQAAAAAQPASSDSEAATSSSGSDTSSSSSSSRASVSPSEASARSHESNDSSATLTEQPREAVADFDSWYLRQMTGEFADDLDRMRGANDFTDASLPVLIQALKECAATYTEEQKGKIVGGQATN